MHCVMYVQYYNPKIIINIYVYTSEENYMVKTTIKKKKEL